VIPRGRIQLRGYLRWKWRRLQSQLRAGSQEMGHLPIVLGNAIPKTGSKLLLNILRGLPRIGPFVDTGLNAIKPYMAGQPTPPDWIARQLAMLRPGDVRFGYLHATPQNLALACRPGWAVFQILRDPRDTLVSGIFYALELHTDHVLNEYYRGLDSMEARLSAAIRGIPDEKFRLADIATIYGRYAGWLDQPQVCALRFEDLVSDRSAQLDRMLSHLEANGFELPGPRAEALEALAAQMDPRKSETFRKGKAGGWREHFTSRNKAEFKERAGELLVSLGYEQGMDW
jgi:hypothetical protein